ncbi:altronate dehydratase family protein [Pseudolactococcus yaeyamensis]
MSKNYMKINPNDNVVVILQNVSKGIEIAGVTALEDIHFGHKLAIKPIKSGENILKYGFPIGHATQDIAAGEWIHTHNVKTNLNDVKNYDYKPVTLSTFQLTNDDRQTFQGYTRENGEVGIREDLYIVPTVGCVNQTAQRILDTFSKDYPELSSIFDNQIIPKHPYGCSQLGKDHEQTKDFLARLTMHPNAGGVLVLGLGCENNTIDAFKTRLEEMGGINPNRVKFLIAQMSEDEIADGIQLLVEIAKHAQQDKRTAVPISKLRVGLKCGGSDGFSGITANPLLGLFSDYLTNHGGTSVLTEVPEMFGAEEILMSRAENQAVFEKIVTMINDFKSYFLANNEPVYENPSPGNKAGGITTLEDKSLGCTQKSGNAKVVDVLNYTDKLKKNGLNLLEAPGNDLVAASALAVSGCHLILFTTGRGNPFGTFVPTIKVSSNTELATHKSNWIDFDAGVFLSQSKEDVLREFVTKVLDIANGELAKNERNGYQEIAIFKKGITL